MIPMDNTMTSKDSRISIHVIMSKESIYFVLLYLRIIP